MGSKGDAPALLIAGASARAAAFSAVRAGLRPACADLFADADLASVAEVTAVADWPGGIERWAEKYDPAVPLVYVGGLENEPDLLDRLARARPLCGVFGDPLRIVRTPKTLSRVFHDAGFRFPRIADLRNADANRCWLVKPRRSAAGRGIRRWDGRPDGLGEGEYLQEFIEGVPGSAAFLAHEGRVELIGTTVSLLPEEPPLSDAIPFAYAGSITTEGSDAELDRLGRTLAASGLQGLFGVDYVRTSNGCVLLEVNPRYTAGMELMELKAGRSLIAEQLAAYGHLPTEESVPTTAHRGDGHFGKQIVYAPKPLRVTRILPPSPADVTAGTYLIADVPPPGTFVPALGPVCTVFAEAETAEECRDLLRCREMQVLEGLEDA